MTGCHYRQLLIQTEPFLGSIAPVDPSLVLLHRHVARCVLFLSEFGPESGADRSTLVRFEHFFILGIILHRSLIEMLKTG